jgi:Uma2 family endonuclease
VAKAIEQQSVRRHRFTVEEYQKMGEAGIIHEDDRVELIDGEVLEMSPISWRHAWCVRMLNRVLSAWTLQGRDENANTFVSSQDPFALDDYGEPQPDLAILRDPPVGRLPGPEQLLLAVEVADTSLAFDSNVKLPRYAEVGIPETWLADLNADRFEVHAEPGPAGYRKTTRYARGERVESATLPDLAFDASEMLPPTDPEQA